MSDRDASPVEFGLEESTVELCVVAHQDTPREPCRNVACEISEFHGDAVAEHFSALDGEIRCDLSGKERFVIGSRRGRL